MAAAHEGVGFRDRLIAAGMLLPTGIDGLWGLGATIERILSGVDHLIDDIGAADDAEVMRFPPAMARAAFEKSGYLKNFPHLAGTVHCFCGDERAHRRLLDQVAAGEDWQSGQVAADLVLTPAACYPVYPLVAGRGPLGEGGHQVDVASWCFRHEPSIEPARFQLFRIREHVRLGTADEVIAFRATWIERAQAVFAAMDLPFVLDVANDPFFGRAGRLMADNQRAQELKFELLVPVNDGDTPTACASFNYHMTHFGDTWGLRTPGGAVAHTACVGFGMERIALALLRRHGFDLAVWPAKVRGALRLA